MHFVVIADTFPPLRTSGAVQLRDLARSMAEAGHKVTVLVPAPELDATSRLDVVGEVNVLRLQSPRLKDIGYLRRAIHECAMPVVMYRNWRKSGLSLAHCDAIVWYSPSIFLGILVWLLRRKVSAPSYLIVRDIFPQWALHMGLLKRGPVFSFFDAIAQFQYRVAQVIGVQTAGDLPQVAQWNKPPERRVEVLENWLAEAAESRTSLIIADTSLRGRRVFVYAGNMGVAQGLDVLMQLAERWKDRLDVGFLFVGRGSEQARLARWANDGDLANVLFVDEVEPDEIPAVYRQCAVGLLSLDQRHRSHNIPGKFLSYMQNGLPVLASVNPGNDLADLIRAANVGRVIEAADVLQLEQMADELLHQIQQDPEVSERCRCLFGSRFSAARAVEQIAAAMRTAPTIR